MDFLLQQMLNALQWGSFYALIALGYTLVYGVLRLINFAHGDIFMVGAYISFFVATYLLSPAIGLSKPVTLWLTIVLTMLLTALVGVTLERIAYRPLRRKGAHRLYVVITALMCGLILENGNLALLGATKRKLPDLVDKVVYSIGPLVVTNLKLWVILAAIVVFALLQTVVTRTKVGMAMRAVAKDFETSQLMGIKINSVISVTFVIGSALAAVGSMLYFTTYPAIVPTAGAMPGLKAFVAAVFGGIGSIPGAVIGAFLIGICENFVKIMPFDGATTFVDAFTFALLIIILVFKPTGLFGEKATDKV